VSAALYPADGEEPESPPPVPLQAASATVAATTSVASPTVLDLLMRWNAS
jgi:hypothetical protein